MKGGRTDPIQKYMLQDDWATTVRDAKDFYMQQDIQPYTIERIAQEILRFIRYRPIRQYNLFTQRRGEDFDTMMATLEEMGFDLALVREMTENEDFWQKTLELAEE